MISRLPLRLSAALALALAGAQAAQAAPVYHLVDLGTDYMAKSINKNGVIAGYGSYTMVPSIYRNGHWSAIGQGDLGMPSYIDAAGDVLGADQTADHDVLWPHGGGAAIVVNPKAPSDDVDLIAVNDHQVVAGADYDRHDKDYHCFRWENGIGKDLHAPGDCVPSDINRQGWIAGAGINAAGVHEGFVWAGGHFHWIDGYPGFSPARLNDAGHMAGAYTPASAGGWDRAALYDGQQVVDLGVLPGGLQSMAIDLNAGDEVVGVSPSSNGGGLFLYTGGQMYDISTLVDNGAGWDLTTVAGISDDGTIIGTGNIGGVGRSWMAVRVSD